MKTLLHVFAGALIVGASLPALAQAGIHPESVIPDNLPRLASPGPYDDFIKQVQEKLNQAGFDAGPVNGDFGEKTQAALAQYQLANLLPASGALDGPTLLALDLQRPSDPSRPTVASEDGNASAGGTQPAEQR
jgi:peptidoglycan hydrolase-like protein with peptidoglycan-binding domain